MMTSKLLASSLLLIGLSGFGLTVYAVGPSIASSVKGSVVADVSGSAGQTSAGLPSLSGSTNGNGITLEASKAITATEPLTGSLKIATAIANYFKVPVADVAMLHDGGWGYGEIFKLYALAQDSGKTVAEIKAMRDAGQGWGQIAKALKLSPGNQGANLGSIVRGNNGARTPGQSEREGKGKAPNGKGKDNGNDKDNGD